MTAVTQQARLISFFWPKRPANGEGIRLPGKLVLLCHGIRIAVVVLLVWRLWLVTRYSLDAEYMINSFKNYRKIDVSGMSELQLYGIWIVNVIILWSLQAGIYLSLAQMFTGFIRGEVFQPETGIRLRRAGLFDLSYIIATPLREVLVVAIATIHLPDGPNWIVPSYGPGPLYDFILGATGIVLGQVLKVAAEIARENQEIV